MGRRILLNGEQEKQEKVEKERRKEKKKGKKKKRDRSKENRSVALAPFQRKNKDGSTSLAILSPGFGIIPGTERDRPISLGSLIGRVRVGTSYLHGFREDKRNIVKAMYPISYNFYSSYGPSYDSTFSNLTMEESQLVQGSDKFVSSHSKQYSDLIRSACLEDYTNTFVDHLIDILEGRSSAETQQESPQTADSSANSTDITNSTSNTANLPDDNEHEQSDSAVDFDALKSLTDDGIDMSFVDNLRLEYENQQQQPPANPSIAQRLDFTATLIQSLRTTQNNRLAVCPNLQLNQVEPPSQTEVRLASQVLDSLTSLLHKAQPGDVVDINSIRKAMGIRVVGAEHCDLLEQKLDRQCVSEEAKSDEECVQTQQLTPEVEAAPAIIQLSPQPMPVLNGHI